MFDIIPLMAFTAIVIGLAIVILCKVTCDLKRDIAANEEAKKEDEK